MRAPGRRDAQNEIGFLKTWAAAVSTSGKLKVDAGMETFGLACDESLAPKIEVWAHVLLLFAASNSAKASGSD